MRELGAYASCSLYMTQHDAYALLTGSPPPVSDLAPADADVFYADSLRILAESQIPCLVAGTFADQLLYRHQPGDQGSRHLLQGGRLPAHPAALQGSGLRDRDRGRALDREGPARGRVLRRDLRLGHRGGHGHRPLVPGKPSGRALRRDGAADPADRDDLVEGAAAEPAPLRRCRHRPSDPAPERADRLAAAADAHGAVLGGAADAPPELPLHLPVRARPDPALAHGRAAAARAPAGRPAAAADQGLPRPPVLGRGLPDRRHSMGLRRRGRARDPGSDAKE